MEKRQHPPLRRTIGRHPYRTGSQMLDIVTQLAVDKADGIVTFGGKQAGLFEQDDITGLENVLRTGSGQSNGIHGFK